MFIRAIGVALTIAALWWSSSSFGVGLGLGEVKLGSTLSSPLEASIMLSGLDDIGLDPEQLSIRIDGESRFKIEYRLQPVDADTALIHLYTRDPLAEPLVQFRVEVSWDRNAVTRTYDVFVDPPAYQEYFNASEELAARQSQDAAPQGSEPESGVESLTPIALDESAAGTTIDAARPAEASSEAVLVDDAMVDEAAILEPAANAGEPFETRREYGPTIDGNSIWRVARAVATDNPGLTIYQWMYATWKANPHAFMGNNMHRLQIGEVLQVPLEQEVAEFSHAEAWRVYNGQMALLQKPEAATAADVEVSSTGVSGQAKLQAAAAQPESPRQPVGGTGANESTAMVSTAAEQTTHSTGVELETLAVDAALLELLERSAAASDGQDLLSERAVNAGVPEISAAAPGTGSAVGDGTEVSTAGLLLGSDSVPTASDSLTASASVPVEVVLDDIDPLTDATPAVTAETPIATRQPDVLPPDSASVQTVGWYQSLQTRQNFIAGLPVIGSEGSLAFVGRSLRWIDGFVATSPSWAALTFGAWLSLVLMLLQKELRARRVWARGMPAVRARIQSARRIAGQDRQLAEPQRQPMQRPPDSNAREIIAQADSILANGDAEEAIKLMQLAVDLQPHQPALVYRLLELYQQTRRTEAFDSLLNHSLPVLQMLDAEDQVRLREIYSRMLPDSVCPLIADASAGNIETPDRHGHAPGNPSLTAQMVEESQGLNLLGNGASENFSSRYGAVDTNPGQDSGEDEYVETQVIYTEKGVPLREDPGAMPAMVGEIIDLGVTLKEADVFLAYGLYDSAEELLLKGMEVDPERVDFLARLLDTYYATQNLVDFVSCAEVLLDMGEAGSEYWDKVEIMGYELAPYNKMFAGGKDRSLGAVELELAKPETADFDFSEIDEDSEASFAEFEIDEDDEDELASADLNLDLAVSNRGDADEDLDELLNFVTSKDIGSDDAPVFEIDEDDEIGEAQDELDHILSLETSKLLAIPGHSDNANGEDTSSLDFDADGDSEDYTGHEFDDEVMRFTIESTGPVDTLGTEAEPEVTESSLSVVEDSSPGSPRDSSLNTVDGRILYFPENSKEGKTINEFESEVKVTLQAIRDQLQHMTERMFRQERETSELQQTVAELGKQEATPKRGKNKKSS